MADSLQAPSSVAWDYIFVGGGLCASVVAGRLSQLDKSLKILVIEAGPDSSKSDIIWENASTTPSDSELDWKYSTVSQKGLDCREISMPAGKALGGGTVINAGGWIRGHKTDFDLWGSKVQDARWSYDGLLPYMKKSEAFRGHNADEKHRGLNGPVSVDSTTSMKREFPLRDKLQQSWRELGVDPLDGFDANAGQPLGIGEIQLTKRDGVRQISSNVYSLDGVTVMTGSLVEKVLIESRPAGADADEPAAVGVRLQDGTELRGSEIVLSAGALRSPQILMLSGVGPAEELNKHGIPILLDQPEVGSNLSDHGLFAHAWKIKDPSGGWAIGSGNPIFEQPQYQFSWGVPSDFVVTTDVPKEGLAKAIEEDEGVAPDPETHELLCQPRAFIENLLMYAGAPNGSMVTSGLITLLPTARGSVRLASSNATDAPLIDPNFFGTAVDRYVAREGIKRQLRLLTSTELGREILNGEAGAPGFDEVLTDASTDEYIDSRLRAGLGFRGLLIVWKIREANQNVHRTSYHPMGTLAMGAVTDTNLRIKGVRNLRVVDASVLPVPITGHIQAVMYAVAEQAADIFSQST